MKIILAADDGEVLDSEPITRAEYDNLSAAGALALLKGMSPGPDAR